MKQLKWLFMTLLVLLLPSPLFSYLQYDQRTLSIGHRLASATAYVNVNVSGAKQMIESDPDFVILDVRTLEEYESGHIQNATLIPVIELASRLSELNKEKEILVYCRTGVRSATASQTLVDNGFSKVYNMLGGITAWRDAGYWIELTHDLNNDRKIDIIDISIVAKAFGSKLGDFRWNPAADLNKDGVINIVDISLLAKKFGKTA